MAVYIYLLLHKYVQTKHINVVCSLISSKLMVLNIIETANATDFITSPGMYRLRAPKTLSFFRQRKVATKCYYNKVQYSPEITAFRKFLIDIDEVYTVDSIFRAWRIKHRDTMYSKRQYLAAKTAV